MKLQNRKGAIELSLNLIIMLIIGIVILGLVIGFVSSLVSDAEASYKKGITEDEQRQLDEVGRCNENLCVKPYPSLDVERGKEISMFMKVRAFGEEIDCSAGELNSQGCQVEYEVVSGSGLDVTPIILEGPGFTATGGQDNAQRYILKVGPDTEIGTYYMELYLYRGTTNEVKKTITVDVV